MRGKTQMVLVAEIEGVSTVALGDDFVTLYLRVTDGPAGTVGRKIIVPHTEPERFQQLKTEALHEIARGDAQYLAWLQRKSTMKQGETR